jgi:hypothetical protein
MSEADPNNPPQPEPGPPLPPHEDDGGFRVKVLLGGILILFVLVCILVAVLVATRERGVNKNAAALPQFPTQASSHTGPPR